MNCSVSQLKIFLISFLFIFVNTRKTSLNDIGEVINWTTETMHPVSVDVYYEALCPDSRQFINTQLWPMFKDLYQSGIMKISLYPYGNTKEVMKDGRWKFTCEHGNTECLLNTLEACVMYIYGVADIFLPYIHCVELNPTLDQAKRCASKHSVDWKMIMGCTRGSIGNALEYTMGRITRALNPKHTFLPWIVVNGKSGSIRQRALKNLKEVVCSEYTGVRREDCI